LLLQHLFAYINYRFLKLPSVIGIMVLALLTSLLLIGIGISYPKAMQNITSFLYSFDFSKLLLGSMLIFMLFAGAIRIKILLFPPVQFIFLR